MAPHTNLQAPDANAAATSSVSPPRQNRIGTKTQESAFETAVDILAVVSQVTQSIPYLTLVSGLLAQIIRIREEVDAYQKEWTGVMEDVEQIRQMVDRFREHCEQAGRSEASLPPELRAGFKSLETCMDGVLQALVVFRPQSKGIKARVLNVIQREKRRQLVQRCRADVGRQLSLFNTELQIHQFVKINELWGSVQLQGALIADMNSPYPNDKLPPPPAILTGRDHEVQTIINMVVQNDSAHIAILGTGGIGKTSVSLAVLHSPAVVNRFENRRFFVACDAATSVDSLVLEIMKVFDMTLENGISPTTKVLAFLKSNSCIICLDNFETPWDADTHAVEEFLGKISLTTNTTLLITSRGRSRPLQTNWTKPLLPPLESLTVEAALEAWESICGEKDSYAEKLVQAVECVPLAVTLLAHLAEADCAEVVWLLWNKKFTAMVARTHNREHRLNSMDFSIELSLQNPRIAENPEALRVLSVLCMLPLGIRLASVDAMEEAFEGLLPDILTSRLVLMQTSLAYSVDSSLRVLSPIRHYIQKRHRPDEPLLDHLEGYFVSVASQPKWRASLAVRQTIYIELGNISAVFEFSLERSSALATLIEGVLVFSDVCTMLSVYDTKLLTLAAEEAAKRAVSLQGRCLGRLGFMYYFLDRLNDASTTLSRSIAIHAAAEDHLSHATDLRVLARLHIRQKRVADAEEELLRSIALLQNINAEEYMHEKAQTLWVLGTLYRRENRVMEAEEKLKEALELGDDWCRPDVLLDFGHLHIQMGDLVEAERVLLEAAELHGRAENLLGRGHDVQRLGYVYTQLAHFDKARAMFEEALELHAKTGSQRGQAFDHRGLAKLHMTLNRFEDALEAYKQAAELQRKAGEDIAVADTLRDMSEVYIRVERREDAEATLKDAVELRSSAGHEVGKAEDLKLLGDLYVGMGRATDARTAYTGARDIYVGTNQAAHAAILSTLEQLEANINKPFVRKSNRVRSLRPKAP